MDFWRALGLSEIYEIAVDALPALLSEGSTMSMAQIYIDLRLSYTKFKDLFIELSTLKRGVQLLQKFEDPNSRGPLLLLTAPRIKGLPFGTVIWKPTGEYKIIGVDSIVVDENYVWGIRPIEHEFDTQPSTATFPVQIPPTTRLREKVALSMASLIYPGILSFQKSSKEAREISLQLEKAMVLVGEPFALTVKHALFGLNLETRSDTKVFWMRLGLWKEFDKEYPRQSMFLETKSSLIDIYLRLRRG